MTNNEALDWMCKRCYNHEMCMGTGCEPKKVIQSLVEQQIPKKPHKSKSEYYCPSCPENTCVGKNHYDGHRTRHDFCFNCGQAILWEDDND